MQSQIKIHSNTLQGEKPQIDSNIIVQSFSSYFAYIELFEYNFTKTTVIDFSVTEPSYFMWIDRKKNTCSMCYRPAEKYKKALSPGKNTIILITFKSDWLLYKCKRLPDLQPFNTLHNNPSNKPVNLPCAGISENIYKSLQKMNTQSPDNSLLDNDGYKFANSCINKYYNRLKLKYTTEQFHHRLADEVSKFIHTHFTTDQAENIPKLAEKFMISERNLARIANIAFGIPLHEQVIKLRMVNAQHLLATTNKPVKEIALMCGYKDPHYFSNAYKKYFGESPKSTVSLRLYSIL
jgi:AraC-like DNA-binding protein